MCYTYSVIKEGGETMEVLKKFRLENGYSQNEMAERLGVSKSFYEKVEYGDRGMSRDFLQKFKRAFPHYDMNIFFGDEAHAKCTKPA